MDLRGPWLVVFDCDGTLVDSQATIVGAMGDAWRAVSLSPPPTAAILEATGLSLEQAIRRLAPTASPADLGTMAEAYRRAFHARMADPNFTDPLYPGIREALDALESKGAVLAIATGKGSRGLRATLDRHGLTARFRSLQTADRARGKPDPEMLLNAMRDTGIGPVATLMIGDTSHDMEMAARAKVASLGVLWGFHDRAALAEAGAMATVEDAAELPGMVLRLLAGRGA